VCLYNCESKAKTKKIRKAGQRDGFRILQCKKKKGQRKKQRRIFQKPRFDLSAKPNSKAKEKKTKES
jgi:hypothetical protein